MSLKAVLTGILVLGVAGGGVFLFLQSGQGSRQGALPPGTQTQEILLQEYASQTFGQYKGTPVVANSWAIWCPFCVKELADFAAVQQEFGQDVVILAINRQESLSAIQNFLGEIEVGYQDLVFLLDPTDSFYRTELNGFSMPETLFIDKEGNIHFHKRGPMDQAEIRERIQAML